MFQPAVLLLFILVTSICRCSLLVERTSNGAILNAFRLIDLPKLPEFARVKALEFRKAEIPFASLSIFDQLTECKYLVFREGTVKQIQMKNSLVSLTAEKTKTEGVIIDLGSNYKLAKLSITQCYLTRIPENLNELKELEDLNLSNNRIDFVTMDNFKGMKKLKSIDLNYNQIKHVLTVDESITLPKLEQLMLSNNQLYELDVCGWLMPSLGSAYLRSNELTYVIGLSTNNFRAIKHLDLGNNPLNCHWKEGFEKYAEDRNLFLSNHVDCDYSHEDTVPSSCKFTAAMNSKFKAWWNAIEAKSGAIVGDVSNRFSNGGGKLSIITDQLEGHIEAKVRIQIEELNRKLVMMEKKFIKQMAEQRNMIDDLVEVIYRMEIERVYNKTQNRG
ncbi:lumican-like [Aedes albopictus]|uniref:Cpij004912 membrane glycoprotein lig-1 n=1 Tax=Aedes albopictus TaxID=7160 RepID=A0ABM1ZLZ4_AEDAL